MKGDYESVKLRKDLVVGVRKHVEETGQTISGFISLAIRNSLKRSNKKTRKT